MLLKIRTSPPDEKLHLLSSLEMEKQQKSTKSLHFLQCHSIILNAQFLKFCVKNGPSVTSEPVYLSYRSPNLQGESVTELQEWNNSDFSQKSW